MKTVMAGSMIYSYCRLRVQLSRECGDDGIVQYNFLGKICLARQNFSSEYIHSTDLFTSQMRAHARIGALALGTGSKLVLCERREVPTCPVFFWAPYLFDLFRSERAMVRYSLASCQHTVFSRSATELNQGLPVFYSVLLLSFTSDETRQHRSLGSLTNDIYGRQLKGYKDLST
jgi:hypothetical protein